MEKESGLALNATFLTRKPQTLATTLKLNTLSSVYHVTCVPLLSQHQVIWRSTSNTNILGQYCKRCLIENKFSLKPILFFPRSKWCCLEFDHESAWGHLCLLSVQSHKSKQACNVWTRGEQAHQVARLPLHPLSWEGLPFSQCPALSFCPPPRVIQGICPQIKPPDFVSQPSSLNQLETFSRLQKRNLTWQIFQQGYNLIGCHL